MNRSSNYIKLSLFSVFVLLFGMFVFPSVYSETVSFTTQISPITILSDEFIPLLDTSTTGNLTSVSVTANLPCDSSNNPLVTIVAGILGDTTNIIDSSSDFIGNGPRDTCVFRDNITNVTAANIPTINTIFLNHTGSSPVHIPQGVMVTLSGVFGNQTTPVFSGIVATGGSITTDGDFKIHTFTSSGTFEVTSGSGDVEYLVVAGGGYCGGGGAGGLLTNTGYSVSTSSYTVTVGAGGSAGDCNIAGTASDGGDSIFDTITSDGSGAGSGTASHGNPGGSGSGAGGGGGDDKFGGSATVGQGNDGGDTLNHVSPYPSAGGGGAGEKGEDATSGNPGDGGDGLTSSISGTSTFYAGGGAGSYVSSASSGVGGSGGGGDYNTAGTANTGGGGGGAEQSNLAGIGGSGVVIIKYQFQ